MKFNDKLVLNSYLLSLFAVDTLQDLAKELKDSRLEELDTNDNSLFYHSLKDKLISTNKTISDDKLLQYDENIVRHTKSMGRDIRWKYFQYLSLLFVEIYLDKYFENKEQLLADLNIHLDRFNDDKETKDKLEPYCETDLNKLALYSATGSGKTLLMHINLSQFNHYAKGKINIKKAILITPNEGLSSQHIAEFKASKIEAGVFDKDKSSSLINSDIEVIEITKIADESGDKTVAVDSFEENNLVFIDEGHRGSSGDRWKTNRDKLSKKGFAFEYSATFAQAINSSTGTKKKILENEYAKSIVFDYSYRYFYNDGYGKDWTILNLGVDSDDTKQTYLTASLLSFYQQTKIYQSDKISKKYMIEKPLMVFVGASVNAVRTQSHRQVSDVVDVLLFIDEFIKNTDQSIASIEKIISLDSGLQTSGGADIFDDKFGFINDLKLDATQIYDDMRKVIFNTSSGSLHIENLKGVGGEIALKIGQNSYFGVINVGDSDKLVKMCKSAGMTVSSREFSSSLFDTINDTASSLNILIGSKKFSEGWSSWRVSTMGLINIGKKEGSQIIQLFGRGVRLKGYDFCLKRSGAIGGKELEKKYQAIETLNIFGLKADYMRAFRDYLKEEGVPTDEKVHIELPLKYDDSYKEKKLKILDLKNGKNFKKDVKLELKYSDTKAITKKVIHDLYRQVDMLNSKNKTQYKHKLNSEILQKEHMSFIDIDRLYLILLQYKEEKRWSNLAISKADIKDLIDKDDWYQLNIPKKDMEINSFEDIVKFETIVATMLKKYMKAFYEYNRNIWQNKHLIYREFGTQKDKANLIKNYTVTVEANEKELIETLLHLKKDLEADKQIASNNSNSLKVFCFDRHIYNPLVYKHDKMTTMSIVPVHLNDGEKDFVEDLDKYLKGQDTKYHDTEIYLLRNQSKTGIGFFTEDGIYYPDFIMWIVKDTKQFITFIDPKGLININTKNNSKINLSKSIKDIETNLACENIVLNSFIVSVTPYGMIRWTQDTLDKAELESRNVLFQKDDKHSYIDKMFYKIFI